MPRSARFPRDTEGAPIPVLSVGTNLRRSLTTSVDPVAVTSANFPDINGSVVLRIVSEEAGFHINLDGPATASSAYVPPGVPMEISTQEGKTLSLFPSSNPTTVHLTHLY